MELYAKRRAALARALGDGVAVIPAAPVRLRNRDTEYEFRQSSDFYYLTGFNEPDAVLVIAPHREKRAVLFTLPRDRSKEIWTGKRAGVEGALETYKLDEAFVLDDLDERLPDYLTGASALYYDLGHDETFDRQIRQALEKARSRARRKSVVPHSIHTLGSVLHEQRLVKSPEEIALMRRAGAITRLGHMAGMRATRPGLPEYELEAVIEHTYRINGAQDVAYPSIVAGGANATILHYNSNRETLRDGDLVLVDSGCEFETYASDVTRTWPVNGRFSPEQRAVYEIVLAAQKAAIDCVRPGRSYDDAHHAAVRVITDGLIELGLLSGSRDENVESERYRDFYYHTTGHWIGLDVHDVGAYTEADGKTARTLQPGMTLTVEPGLYVPVDLPCDERFKGIGVRIEDDILCAPDGPDNLTADIPKEIDELEALAGADVVAGVR